MSSVGHFDMHFSVFHRFLSLALFSGSSQVRLRKKRFNDPLLSRSSQVRIFARPVDIKSSPHFRSLRARLLAHHFLSALHAEARACRTNLPGPAPYCPFPARSVASLTRGRAVRPISTLLLSPITVRLSREIFWNGMPSPRGEGAGQPLALTLVTDLLSGSVPFHNPIDESNRSPVLF